MPPTIHVLLADGHPVPLAALAEMTARLPGVVVAGTVATGTELLARLAQTPAGVVLLDADLPPAGGLQTTRWLKAAYPAISVLLLTLDNPLALVKKMLAAGAAGYVPKTVGRDALERAIRTAAAGLPYFGEHVAAELARQYVRERGGD